MGGFVQLDDGFIYSATTEEGVENANAGTFYRINHFTNTIEYIHTLEFEGTRPKGTFTESPNGRLYITCSGEGQDNGSIVEYNPANGEVTKRHSFNAGDGTAPLYNELAIVDLSSLSIREASLSKIVLNIFPNPSSDIITIQLDNQQPIKSIQILDLKGSELFVTYPETYDFQLNTSFLSNGTYLLKVESNSGNAIKKFIKE